MCTPSMRCFLSLICDIVLWLLQIYIYEGSSLNVILHQKLNVICRCALRITLSKKAMELRVLDYPKIKSAALSYSL